ncbi:MAG: hypothetical protein MSIBF_01970 [Candidatus Altiarchaeales archaeon IMC4]|nr:MAG: hypothetical protein MSIBF_01970 [Candidatus Altiarchaeales archaeon IMC4]
METKFYSLKDEIRIIGIDDGSFDFRRDKTTILVGAIFRGGRWLDGILKTEVEIDGTDSTDKIISLISKTRHKDIRVIMLDGINFAGFNIVDIERLSKETKLPVIVIVRKMPDFESIKSALKKFDNHKERIGLIEKAGWPAPVETRPGKFVHIQHIGITKEDAAKIVKLSATRSLIPEPVRAAHLIASGIVLGESRGRA